jgi:hypothetical protein
MIAAFEKDLIYPFVTGYKLDITVDKVSEAECNTAASA